MTEKHTPTELARFALNYLDNTHDVRKALELSEQRYQRLQIILERRQEELKAMHARVKALERKLDEEESRFVDLTSELATSRAFVQPDDAADVQSVIDGLKQINDAIDDFVYTTIDLYAIGKHGDKLLTPEAVAALEEAKHASRLTSAIARAHLGIKDATLVDVMIPCLSTMVIDEINNQIFAPFRPGMCGTDNREMLKLERSVRGKGLILSLGGMAALMS